MMKRWVSKAALVAIVLACANTGAYAIPIPETIDFEDVTAGPYPATSSFVTTANNGAGNPYTFNVNAGNAAVDTGAPGSSSDGFCTVGGTGCSSNGTQALYVFNSGAVMLQSALSNYVMTLTSFDAAIASINSPFPEFGFTQATLILVTGQIHGGGSISQLFPLLPPANESFQTQTFAPGFTNLDSAIFAFTIDLSLISDPLILAAINDAGLSGDFAIDNIVLTSTPAGINPPPPPPPTNNVPEPGTLGLLAAGLIGLRITRRRKQGSA